VHLRCSFHNRPLEASPFSESGKAVELT
jgi:hypothetical protein